ncbi:hypothetical protein JWG45_21550 [Leptospira sp. 201903070]|uniref:DUF1064 domain-containing protein n=1 Tax=Leptospira ainlahdjerensis TaxID=2810033 RepID=A0ABS2UIH7_9LEPT|nr:hypothetical protein [Leptospira ainlahdjerensis]MBM9579739.1 hypothetical protein [Leptospira ainlahdjerensis]
MSQRAKKKSWKIKLKTKTQKGLFYKRSYKTDFEVKVRNPSIDIFQIKNRDPASKENGKYRIGDFSKWKREFVKQIDPYVSISWIF